MWGQPRTGGHARTIDSPCGPRDLAGAPRHIGTWLGRPPFQRAGQDRRQPRRLGRRQLRRADAEILPGGRLGAIDARAPFDGVQIDLHDPRLAPDHFDQDGEIGLQPFAHIGPARPQEDILGGLLADGRTPAQGAALGVALIGLLDGREVETAMLTELGVLGRDHGADEAGRDLVQRPPAALEALALEYALDHQPGDRRRRETIDRGDHHRPDQAKDQHQQQHSAQQPAKEPVSRRPRQHPCPYPTARC